MSNSSSEEFKINYESVEDYASSIEKGYNGLGQEFKEEYKDSDSTLIACDNLDGSFEGERRFRNTLRIMSTREKNFLLNIKDEFGILDEQLSDMLNDEFFSYSASNEGDV